MRKRYRAKRKRYQAKRKQYQAKRKQLQAMKKWFHATEKLLREEEPVRPGLKENLSQGLTFYKFVVSKLDLRQ
jgi:hypothetical protein